MEAATAINKNFGHVHKMQLDLRMVEIWSNFIKKTKSLPDYKAK